MDTKWEPIETAPKGTGGDYPHVLLLFSEGEVSVGYWDLYWAEGGFGYNGSSAWIEPVSGEQLDLHYDEPIGWMELPDKDTPQKEGEL